MTQLVAFGETSLRLSPADETPLETARDLRLRVDGTESAAAVAAARQGVDALWLSKLPDSPLGRRTVAQLREHGLATDVVWTDGTRHGLTVHEPGRTPREETLLGDRSGTAAGTVEPSELPLEPVQTADVALVGGATAGLSADARRTVEAVLRAADGTTVLALDFRPALRSPEAARRELADAVAAADVLIVTEAGAKAVFDREGQPRELVHSIAAERSLERVVLARGDRGAVAWHDSVVHEQPAPETTVVDPTGGHAALVGGFLAGIAGGEGTDDALARGVATAALTRTTPGPLCTADAAAVDRAIERAQDRRETGR